MQSAWIAAQFVDFQTLFWIDFWEFLFKHAHCSHKLRATAMISHA